MQNKWLLIAINVFSFVGATLVPTRSPCPFKSTEFWTTHKDGEVKLRMGESDPEAEPPLTVNADVSLLRSNALVTTTHWGWKEGEQWKTMNYNEYYKSCRTAAKSFLKGENQRFYTTYILHTILTKTHSKLDWHVNQKKITSVFITSHQTKCDRLATSCPKLVAPLDHIVQPLL